MEDQTRATTTFDDALTQAEEVANAAIRAATAVTSRARKLRKSAGDGNVADLRKVAGEIAPAQEKLRGCLDALLEAVDAAAGWPAGEDGEQSFKERYSAELCAAAEARDLAMRERDGLLTTFPSIVSVSDDQAVLIDRKRVPAIRPARVVDKLVVNRRKADSYSPDQFLASLHRVYGYLSKGETSIALPTGEGPVVPLTSVYNLLTARPGAKREYTKVDFARDLFALEYRGITRTKNGAEVFLTGSTGTRQSGFFAFVGPDGQEGKWSGVKFRTDSQ